MVGKKKRGHPDVEEVLARPWCYYCERDFDDLKILISHQKAKHFKCERCGRRLNTAGGLSVHMNQVHKETLTTVENALGNRAGLEVEIFGMEGIPEDVVQAHNQRIIAQFYQAEAERRAATGNTGGGGGVGGQSKKPKFESPSELKKRLAEHKAKLAEQAAGGGSSGGNTPAEGVNGQNSAATSSPGQFNGSPFPPPQATYAVPPQQGTNYSAYTQEPYSQATPAYQQPYNGQPGYPPQPQYQPQTQYPPQQFPPNPAYPAGGYQQPPFPGAQQQPQYGASSPPASFNPYQAPPSHSPPPGLLPNRPPSLPQAPGLPQRPSFGGSPAPPQQQMHGGPPGQFQHRAPPQNLGWNGNGWNAPPPHNQAMSSAYPNANAPPGDDIDEIIRMAEAGIRPPKKENVSITAPPSVQAIPVPAAEPEVASEVQAAPASETNEKKPKKDKEKNNKMVYTDNEVSPEEKMAKLPRYAFVPDGKEETTIVDVNTAPGVAGVVDE